jgi:predicted esterase
MNDRRFLLCAGALAFAACSTDMPQSNQVPITSVPSSPVSPTAGRAATVPAATAGTGGSGIVSPTAGSTATSLAGRAAGGAAAGGGAGTPVAAAGGAGGVGTGPSAGAGGAPAGAAGAMAAVTTDPKIPDVSGTCPDFKTGTATIGGLGGISLTVGAKKEGTGSLLFYWHGTGSTSGEFQTMLPAAAVKEITDNGGIIVSFQSSTGTGGDCSGTATFSKDDFKITDTITACAVKNYGINPKRIYTTGCSAGGLMAGCMGIQRSNYIAAAAPNSGGITVGYGMIQDPTHIPAVMTMHGSAADMVIVAFSQTSEAYDNFMMKAGGFAINCNHGGGHCGAPADLQAAAWQFMKDHPYGTKPSPYAMGLPSSFPQYCKIWVPTMTQPLGGP